MGIYSQDIDLTLPNLDNNLNLAVNGRHGMIYTLNDKEHIGWQSQPDIAVEGVADLVEGAHPVEDMPWTFHRFAASYLLDAACHATQSQKRCANPDQSKNKHKTYKTKPCWCK